MSTNQTMRQRRKGFTLIELMVVIVIIGIIGTMAFVFLGGEPDRARWERARTEMGQIHTALSRYQLDHGEYPDSLEAVAGSFSNDRIPRDPFTREPYIYERTERGFRLISYGADQSEGGDEIPDRDIEYTERGYVEHD
jgi:general secretion pathway protein G